MSETSRRIKDVVYDFDGTLADSGEVNLEAMATVLGREPFTAEEVEELRARTTLESMKKLGVKRRQLPDLLLKGRRIAGQNMHRIGVFEGIPEALGELGEADYGQFVLSTNSAENISEFLARHGLAGNITEVYGGAGMLSKARRLTSLIRKEGLVAAQCVYVGDEGRDIDAAREAGLLSVAVTWGFQNAEALEAHGPDALVASPMELVGTIEALSAAAA